jgi:protein-disulfide isomerase
MIRKLWGPLWAVLLLWTGVAASQDRTEPVRGEIFIGKADAPITIIAYESLLCPHCASFHTGALPKLKEHYIDKGLVKLVFREFPGDRDNSWPAVPAMVARCLGRDKYFAMIDMMFREQEKWASANQAPQYLDNVFNYARLAGMTREQFDACLKDSEMLRAMYERWREGLQKHGLRGTPHFVVGEKILSGNQSFEEFEKALKPLVEKLPKSN